MSYHTSKQAWTILSMKVFRPSMNGYLTECTCLFNLATRPNRLFGRMIHVNRWLKPSVKKPDSNTPLRDEKIGALKIVFIDENGMNHGVMNINQVLNKIDRKVYWLQAVDMSQKPPICRVFEKKAILKKEKEKEEAKRQAEHRNVEREVTITWTIAPNDMERKISAMRKFAQQGHRVRITIQPTDHQRYAFVNDEDKKRMLNKVREIMSDVAKELRQFNANPRTQILIFQGNRLES